MVKVSERKPGLCVHKATTSSTKTSAQERNLLRLSTQTHPSKAPTLPPRQTRISTSGFLGTVVIRKL